MSPIVDAKAREELDKAIQAMEGYLDKIAGYKSYTVPALYGPYSYGYTIGVTWDGGSHGTSAYVENNGWAEPWAPKKGDIVSPQWVELLRLGGCPNPDRLEVFVVYQHEIPEVEAMRKAVEQESPTLETLINSLTKQDCDTMRECFRAIAANVDMVNVLGPSAEKGKGNSSDLDNYIRTNWRSDGSVEFGKRVDVLESSFGDLYTMLEKMANGYFGLNSALMVFVTAITETLKLRDEDTEEAWSNLVNGGLTVLGVLLDWKSALGWLSLALFAVDLAGNNDSEDRRAAMDRFRNSEAARPIGLALEASKKVAWPNWGDLALSRDFQ